jgi:uncharacterized protein (TIGR03067 family)
MRPCYTVLLICGAVFLGGCGSGSNTSPGGGPKGVEGRLNPPADLKDFQDLLGAWEVTAIEAAGKPVPADLVRKVRVRYVFSENQKVTVSSPGRPDKTASFTVDATTNPKRLTVALSPPVRAIYAVDGTKLRVCLMADESPNTGYPTALASTATPKTDLLTLERR